MPLSSRAGRVLGGWSEDPLWATFYDWTVEHRTAGGLLWRLGIGSDLGLLYDAAEEIGRLPAGARVLDVPCGGGIALRGVRPGQDVTYVAADIAPAMLDRTMASAEARGVAARVEPRTADISALPFGDGEFDLVVSFTGLHCFPDPRAAVAEIVRVLRPGGVLTGSAVLNDSGARYEPMRIAGRRAGLLGPGCTGEEIDAWLHEEGMVNVGLRTSGAIGYFRAVKR
jgi:SAM-dependent methyltransferase